MPDADVAFAGIVRQAQMLAAGEVSSRELVELYLARIERLNPTLNAKTTSPELAICAFTESKTHGATRNPWNPERSPGGSTGGTARRSPPGWSAPRGEGVIEDGELGSVITWARSGRSFGPTVGASRVRGRL